MRVFATVRHPDGTVLELTPGDLVGRAWSAALHVEDPRVSEAHALVSLRGDRLKLLALRGRFAVAGRVRDEVDLTPGLRVHLTPDLALEVLDVALPDEIAALAGDGLAPTALHGAAGLAFRPEPTLVHPSAEDADAWVWATADGWRLRIAPEGPHGPRSEEDRVLDLGQAFTVRGRRFQLVYIPLGGEAATRDRSALAQPLHVVARYETVHVHRRERAPVVLDGVQARLVSELVAFGVPVAWTVLAQQLWSDEADPAVLRKRLDGALHRLRQRLREGGVRLDLVRPNGQGQFELFLEPGDTLEEQL